MFNSYRHEKGVVILRERHRLTVFGAAVLRRICGHTRNRNKSSLTEKCKKLYNEKLENCAPANSAGANKSRVLLAKDYTDIR
jgi:hypothetical protein